MADINRTTVDKLVLHHAVTPLWVDKSKAWLAQWFSDNGFARAYGSNPANWSGLINPYTGARSYSQAHFAGQRVDGSTPDATDAERAAGYRLVELVSDVRGVITYHAGNWPVNCSSIGIENLGDYRNYTLRDEDAKVIAAFWRPQDQALGGATAVYGHLEVSQFGTACPARIMEMRDTVVHYINNPPEPPQPQDPSWSSMDAPRRMRAKAGGATLVEVKTGNGVKNYPAGTEFDLNQKSDWKGKTYLRTIYSSVSNLGNGFDINSLEDLPVVSVKEETKTEEVAYQVVKSTDATLPTGQEKVTRPGIKGVRTIVYTVTYTNNVETARTVKSDSVTTPVINELVSVGSYVEPPVTPPVVPLPEPGESAFSWLTKVFELIKKILESFTYKKK